MTLDMFTIEKKKQKNSTYINYANDQFCNNDDNIMEQLCVTLCTARRPHRKIVLCRVDNIRKQKFHDNKYYLRVIIINLMGDNKILRLTIKLFVCTYYTVKAL